MCPVALYGEFKCQSMAVEIQRTVGLSQLADKKKIKKQKCLKSVSTA